VRLKEKGINMAEFLSLEEIDALLDLAEDDNIVETSFTKSKNKDSLEKFSILGENLSKTLNTKLSKKLKKSVDIKVRNMDQMSFADFILSTPAVTYGYEVKLNETPIVFETNPNIAKKIIHILTGDQTSFDDDIKKEPTKLEFALLQSYQDIVVEQFENKLDILEDMFTITDGMFLSRVNKIESISHDTIVLSYIFEITIDKESGYLNICLPMEFVEQYREEIQEESLPQKKDDTNDDKLGELLNNYGTDEAAKKTKFTFGNHILGDIIRYEIENTFKNILGINTKITDVQLLLNPSYIDEKCLKLDTEFKFKKFTSFLTFYIPTHTATKVFDYMLGGIDIEYLPTEIDEDIEDAVKELIINMSRSIETSSNAQGYEEGDTKFHFIDSTLLDVKQIPKNNFTFDISLKMGEADCSIVLAIENDIE
jgi:flagellar motor switch protein FliM